MELPEIVRRARLRLLRLHFETKIGHLGGNLSCIDLLVTLYHRSLREDDRFLLSKGHAVGAWYVTLSSLGKISDEELSTFHGENTRLPGHPASGTIPEISFGVGSLGHGLPVAIGMALAKRLKREPGRVYCLMSDGEWNEGSNWEGLFFLRHHKIDNLTVVVDCNGLQGFGRTKDVLDVGSLSQRFGQFGCTSIEIDGHDLEAIEHALSDRTPGARFIVAQTVKGRGVDSLAGTVESHYRPLTREQYDEAVRVLERQ